jgi:hypothetical protein
MLKTIEGVYRKGHIEFEETPDNVSEETPVIVTFLPEQSHVDLRKRGITKEEAAEARARFATFEEDWESSEMSIYDDYENYKRDR